MIFLVLLVICLILFILYFQVGRYFYNIALNPKTEKDFVLKHIEDGEDPIEKVKRQKWLNDYSIDVYVNSSSNGNLKLHAYELKHEKEPNEWVIAIHGYMGEGKGLAYHAQEFYKRGYNVLVPDLRGHGTSEGDYIGMGWHDRLDIVDWINYIITRRNKDAKIMIFGISMGAATTMMTLGENLPSNVILAISDCGYTSTWDEFAFQLKQLFKLSTFPALDAANSYCKLKAHYDFKESSSVNQLKKCKIPVLFIHGDADDFVPYKMLDEVYEATNSPKEKLVIEGAGHGLAATVNTELYWKTIDEFISKYGA